MFTSKIAILIDEAVAECVDCGRGSSADYINDKLIRVTADWAENETDIELTLQENNVVRLAWTEEVPEQYR